MSEYKGGERDGTRIRMLEKQRENNLKEMNKMKEKMKQDTQKQSVFSINDKFQSTTDSSTTFQTVGLVSINDFKKNTSEIPSVSTQKKRSSESEKQKSQSKKSKVTKSKLSFDVEEDEEQEEQTKKISSPISDNIDNGDTENKSPQEENNNNNKFKYFGKDPSINTDFLPDQEREEQEKSEREELTKKWLEEQERIKAEPIEITYSYWDGSGHRRTLQCTKGTTIEKFLDEARKEFKELRGVSVDHLLFVKEDLIIPHNYSFYDFIISKARGKSGPLFKFDVHDDVRLVNDATIEKDETHAGKVVEKGWYEKNKHIFPASRWEVYDPTIQRDKYTISDKLSK
eukprot:gene2412-2979_t